MRRLTVNKAGVKSHDSRRPPALADQGNRDIPGEPCALLVLT